MTTGKNEAKEKFGISSKLLKTIPLATPAVNAVWVRKKDSKAIIKIPINQMKATIGKSWENEIYYTDSSLPELAKISSELVEGSFLPLAMAHAHNIEKCYIGDMGPYGAGVFAKEELKANSWFMPNGLVTTDLTSLPNTLSGYGTAFTDQENNVIAQMVPTGVNMATLMQHAPTEKELKLEWELAEELDPKTIATANAVSMAYKFSDLPCAVQVTATIRTVSKNHALMRNYGWLYWAECNKQPKLFYLNGDPVPARLYKPPKVLSIQLKNCEGDFFLPFTHKELEQLTTILQSNKNFHQPLEDGEIIFTPNHLAEITAARLASEQNDHYLIKLPTPMEIRSKIKKPLDEKRSSQQNTAKPQASNSTSRAGLHQDESPSTWLANANTQIALATTLDENDPEQQIVDYETAAIWLKKIEAHYLEKKGNQSLNLQNVYCRLGKVQYALAMLKSKDPILLNEAAATFEKAKIQPTGKSVPPQCIKGIEECNQALDDSNRLKEQTIKLNS